MKTPTTGNGHHTWNPWHNNSADLSPTDLVYNRSWWKPVLIGCRMVELEAEVLR